MATNVSVIPSPSGASSSVPLHGVKLGHLRSLKVARDWTVSKVCDKIIKPLSGDSSYVEHLLTSHETDSLVKPTADVFVSYAWQYRWSDLISALEILAEDDFVWLDVVVVNQHVSKAVELDDWLTTFASAIMAIKKIVLVVSPWDAPVSPRRIWCVYEFMIADMSKAEVVMTMPKKDVEDFKRALVRRRCGKAFFESLFADIDVKKASAYKQSDRAAILGKIMTYGDKKVNDVVMYRLKDLFVQYANAELVQRGKDNTFHSMDTGNVYLALGVLYEVFGNTNIAVQWYKRSYDIFTQFEDVGSVAMITAHLALSLRELKRYKESLTLLEKGEKVDAAVYGRHHLVMVNNYNNQAMCLVGLGEYQSALSLLSRAMEITQNRGLLIMMRHNVRDLRLAHAFTLNNAGECYRALSQLDVAQKYHEEAMAIRLELLGYNHTHYANSLNNYACVLHDRGEVKAANGIGMKAFDILERVLGAQHPVARGVIMEWSLRG